MAVGTGMRSVLEIDQEITAMCNKQLAEDPNLDPSDWDPYPYDIPKSLWKELREAEAREKQVKAASAV